MPNRLFRVLAAAAIALALPVPVGAQTSSAAGVNPDTQAREAPQAGTSQLPVNLEKIKNALEEPPAIELSEDRLKFYLRVYGREPRFEDFVGSFDLRNGPVPRAGMTHQDFVNLVTPKELYGSGGITAAEMLQFALVNLTGQAILKRGIEAIRDARGDRERDRINEQIDRELAALRGGGR